MRASAGAALVLPLLWMGCGWLSCEVTTRPAPPPAGAPAASLRGAVVIEPPQLGAGDVAEVEIVVVTPPGHRLRPVRPPESVPGFWILDAEALPVEASAGRSVHRTRLRARAREPGRFVWPAMTVEVETPEASVVRLELEERPVEVGSVALDFPGRVEPFPLRAPEAGDARPGGLLLAMTGGAALALLAVGLVAAARRRRGGRQTASEPALRAGEPPPAWREALAQLELAAGLVASDPEEAADAAARALRRLLGRRFAVAGSLTSPELRALAPPLGLDRHWDSSGAILAELDELRFGPRAGDVGPRAARAHGAIERARAWIGVAFPEARIR
jgi:hypothetical protein